MKDRSREEELARLTTHLTHDFKRWEHLYQFGGSDPFWEDGVNLNLVRNHIISDKLQIAQLVNEQSDVISFFGVSYPDIYYKETPPKIDARYMARASEIRARANEQLALYEADPNFRFIMENHSKVFPHGETKATKAAGLYIGRSGGLTRYRKDIEADDLVAMRRDFYRPYEEKAVEWAELAKELKAFLEVEHNPEDNVVVVSDYEQDEEDLDEAEEFEEEEDVEKAPKPKKSLDELISGADSRKKVKEPDKVHREEQMSLF